MSSLTKGYIFKDISQKGRAETGRYCVNVGKALPASATGAIFNVTGVIQVTALFGIVSTALAASNVSPTLGVTGAPAAIAAAPAAPLNATGVGAVLVMPLTPGGALPAPVVASGAATAMNRFTVNAASITITTLTTVTGNITWVLGYTPLVPKAAGSVVAV
jgi:hypothetical protein